MTESSNHKKTSISDKDWLDLSFKHFLQHAQQRVQHFNYFIIFSSILTTATIATFQSNFQAHYLGIGLGIIQIFLSFVFSKLDDRNRFLIKHAENVIKNIEQDYVKANSQCYSLFTSEEIETVKEKDKNIGRHFFVRPMSHKKSYNLIYSAFGLIGLTAIIISAIISLKKPNISPPKTNKVKLQLIKGNDSTKYSRLDTLIIQGDIIEKP